MAFVLKGTVILKVNTPGSTQKSDLIIPATVGTVIDAFLNDAGSGSILKSL